MTTEIAPTQLNVTTIQLSVSVTLEKTSANIINVKYEKFIINTGLADYSACKCIHLETLKQALN